MCTCIHLICLCDSRNGSFGKATFLYLLQVVKLCCLMCKYRSKLTSCIFVQVIGSSNVSRGINPSLSGQSQMSSDQVQNEIQAIDSILKALSTDGYSMSSMGKLSELTVEGDISVSTCIHVQCTCRCRISLSMCRFCCNCMYVCSLYAHSQAPP